MTGGRRFSVTVPDWGQDHLSSEAVAAYVDDELADGPYTRATRHLATCHECAAQVVAQGQARAAIRAAEIPSLPASLMRNLRSIPQVAELPGLPTGLAIAPDGQIVSMLRPSSSPTTPPAGLATIPDRRHPAPRRGRIGAGMAISGIALGAIALGAATIPSDTPAPTATADRGVLGGQAPAEVDARLRLPEPPPVSRR